MNVFHRPGPENDTRPDGANTPFRTQRDTNLGGWAHGPRRRSIAGWVRSSRARCIVPTRTCCPHCWPWQASRTSRKGSSMAIGGAKTFNIHIDGFNVLNPRNQSNALPPYLGPRLPGSENRAREKKAMTSRQCQSAAAIRSWDWLYRHDPCNALRPFRDCHANAGCIGCRFCAMANGRNRQARSTGH
jgi:hypothetical protein